MKPNEKKEKVGESTASIPSERLRRRQLLARRQELRDRLQRVHELFDERRALKEQIKFLKQLLVERMEHLREEAVNDKKQKEE